MCRSIFWLCMRVELLLAIHKPCPVLQTQDDLISGLAWHRKKNKAALCSKKRPFSRMHSSKMKSVHKWRSPVPASHWQLIVWAGGWLGRSHSHEADDGEKRRLAHYPLGLPPCKLQAPANVAPSRHF